MYHCWPFTAFQIEFSPSKFIKTIEKSQNLIESFGEVGSTRHCKFATLDGSFNRFVFVDVAHDLFHDIRIHPTSKIHAICIESLLLEHILQLLVLCLFFLQLDKTKIRRKAKIKAYSQYFRPNLFENIAHFIIIDSFWDINLL